MPAITRLTDIASGHGCWPDSDVIQASPNVIVNNLGVFRVTDAVRVHCCVSCHGRKGASGSPDTIFNDLNVMRLFDPIDCGGFMVTGSSDTIVN